MSTKLVYVAITAFILSVLGIGCANLVQKATDGATSGGESTTVEQISNKSIDAACQLDSSMCE